MSIHCRISTIVAVCCLFATVPIRAADSDNAIKQMLLRSNDYLGVVQSYWPRAAQGDIEAMIVVYNALNDCSWFSDKIRESDDINEFETLMRREDPNNLVYGRGIFYRCRNLVEHYDDYLGWEDLRLRAALAGDRGSRVMLVGEYFFYAHFYDVPREAFSYSPAAWLIEAIENRDSRMFSILAEAGESTPGMRDDMSPTVTAAWKLVTCHYGTDCSVPESMEDYCLYMTDECGQFDNMLAVIRHNAGGVEQFAAAQEIAAAYVRHIEDKRYDLLGLNLVW